MENQVTNNENALRLFFTEDVFLVKDECVEIPSFATGMPVSEGSTFTENKLKDEVLPPKSAVISPESEASPQKNYNLEVEIPRIVAEPKADLAFKYLGGNKKSVLILVNDQVNDVSTEQGRDLLRKIVKAIDLATPDFALVNYAQYQGTGFSALHQFFKPVIMLSFGVEISTIQLNLDWNNEIIVHDNTKIIFAPNLHQLDSDIGAKKLLWGNLQKLKA